MYRYISPIDQQDLGTLAAEVDPTAPGGGMHLNFDVILRRCGHAWMTMLKELGGFGKGVIVPRLEVDYHREVGTGELVIDVSVIHVGRTSFRLRLDASQDGDLAARAEVVLVVFDYDGKTPMALSAEQREALARHAA
jgi:acyl-CoA thioesterase FadM